LIALDSRTVKNRLILTDLYQQFFILLSPILDVQALAWALITWVLVSRLTPTFKKQTNIA
jgi:hypothetical protein